MIQHVLCFPHILQHDCFFLLGFNPYGSPQFTGISEGIEKDPPRNCIFNCSSASLTPGGLHDPIATWTTKPFELENGSRSDPFGLQGNGLRSDRGIIRKAFRRSNLEVTPGVQNHV